MNIWFRRLGAPFGSTLLGLTLLLPAHKALAEVPPSYDDAQELGCLQRASQPPQVERLSGAARYLRVLLRFDAPDAAPAVTVLANASDAGAEAAVLDFVRSYRLPCLAQGQAPIQAVQEFHFGPDDPAKGHPLRRYWPLSEEVDRQCMVWSRDYSAWPRATRLTANLSQVLVEGVFDPSVSEVPNVALVASNANTAQEEAVKDYMTQLRMPCLKPGMPPYHFVQKFIFKLNASKPARFERRDVHLLNFLATLEGLDAEKVLFDFHTMSCPFKVSWTAMPQGRLHAVSSLGKNDPNRSEFLAWLRTRQLKMTDKLRDQLLGESLEIEVPCGRLKLPRQTQPQS